MELDFKKLDGLVPAVIQDAGIGRSPDAGLHERGSLRRDADERGSHVLQPLAQQTVAQGRAERPCAEECAKFASIATWTLC